MDGAAYVLLSGTLTFGVPIVLAVRQLIALKRRDDSHWGGDGPPPEPPKPTPKSGEKPLPDCLIPKLPARRLVRELEEA